MVVLVSYGYHVFHPPYIKTFHFFINLVMCYLAQAESLHYIGSSTVARQYCSTVQCSTVPHTALAVSQVRSSIPMTIDMTKGDILL